MNTSLPVQPSQRVALLDVLRGFALFGVLLVNLHAIVFYTTPQEVLAGVSWPMDSVLDRLHHWLFESKFVTLFAMLFGYGFGLLLERLGTKGTAVAGFFFRRMGILFALGLLNLCLWWADILHVYALAGLALLLFRRASNGVVLTSAVVFGFGFTWAHFAFSKYVFPLEFDPALAQAHYPALLSTDFGTMAETNYRIQRLFQTTGLVVYMYGHAIGCILFGYWLFRKDLFGRLEQYVRMIKQVWWIGLAFIAVPWAFVYAGKAGLMENPWFYHGAFPLFQGAIFGMSLFYSTSIILLYRRGLFKRVFGAFAQVGRMSLTNYLVQSILYVVFFYGIGFGLLGKVAYHHIWALCIAFYVLQIAFSAWWMARYHYGPAEWLWRQLSYGRRFGIRRASGDTP
ncbi:MAG: DUF418 domain-containing protein [Flavobacteriales bacterium]|nr:DUF418 domain-containing protein [Flavobacteriales bacterium]